MGYDWYKSLPFPFSFGCRCWNPCLCLRFNNLESLGGLKPNCCVVFNENAELFPASKGLRLTGTWKSTEVPSDPAPFPSLDSVEVDSTEDAADSVELLESECSSIIFPGRLKLGNFTFRYLHDIVEKYNSDLW